MQFHYGEQNSKQLGRPAYTCVETQPVPNPFSWAFHYTPLWWHQFGVLVNHFVELVAPWLLLGPAPVRRIGGLIQIAFQAILIMSGNLAFLNHLTILPAIACLDDSSWLVQGLSPPWDPPPSSTSGPQTADNNAIATSILEEALIPPAAFLPHEATGLRHRRQAAASHKPMNDAAGSPQHNDSAPHPWRCTAARRIDRICGWAYVAAVVWLSVPVVSNLLSPRQVMNNSFDPLRIVNTYGAFGSIGRVRHELVFEVGCLIG